MLRHLLSLSALALSALGSTTLYQFPNGTWNENIQTYTQNGILLTQLSPAPNLVYFNLSATPLAPKILYTFPNATGCTGISTLTNDVYYVQCLKYNFSNLTPAPGSGRLWKVDLTAYNTTGAVTVTSVASLAAITFPNGATGLPGTNLVLIADWYQGKVYSVDVTTGNVQVAVDNGAVNLASGNRFSVNGVRAYGNGYLYYTNTGKNSYGKIPIDNTGKPTGNYTVLFQNSTVTPDDFAVDLNSWGTPDAAYVADAGGNRLIRVTGKSNSFSVAASIGGTTGAIITNTGVYIPSTGGDALYAMNPVPVGGALSKL